MTTPCIIAAVGTSPAALATFSRLDTKIRGHFPEEEIIWSYSARVTRQKPVQNQSTGHLSPETVLQGLAARGITKAVVQSLHLLPGKEFHDLHRSLHHPGIACASAMPLLSAPEDYEELGEILRSTITARPDKAILLIGHGTAHPSWTAYYSLEKILRRKFGERIFVGALEKFPNSQSLPAEIRAAGFSEVCIIPFLLIAGMHYHRDIVGDGPASWTSRLQNTGLSVEAIDHGLGLFPGLEKIIIRHMAAALASLKAI
jgi:sirohydrochlorin cobaltochelatase